MRLRSASRTAGLTLVEVMVTGILVALVIGAALSVGLTATRSYDVSAVHSDTDARAQRVLDRLSRELMTAGVSSLASFPTPPLWDDTTTFDQIDSVSDSDGSITWRTVRIQLEYVL